VIDIEHCVYFSKGTCRACEKVCEAKAVDFEQKDELIEVDAGNIVLATGFDLFRPSGTYEYGYGKLDNVLTSLEFERLVNWQARRAMLSRTRQHPGSVAIIHCAEAGQISQYCSRVIYIP
jgi:heterodisulfide reductase subunit A